MAQVVCRCSSMSVIKWLATVASCTVAAVDFGLLISFAAIFVHLLDKYGDTRAATATVQSAFMGTGSSFGLVAGVLVQRMGVTRVSFAGTLLLSMGFIVSFFATTIPMLVAFIGIFSGIGISLLFVSSSVVLGKLFEGRARETAMAFHAFSNGIGMTGYPYILEMLVVEYGVSGTLLILGGVLTNNFVITCIYSLYEQSNFCTLHCDRPSDKVNESENDVIEGHHTQHKDSGLCNSKSQFSFIYRTIREYFSHLLNCNYLTVVTATGMVVSSVNGLLVVFFDMLIWKGLTTETSLTCLTAANIGNIVVRLFLVFLSRVRQGYNPAVVLIISSICGLIGHLIMLLFTDAYVIIIGSAMTGLAVGGIITGSTLAVASYVNVEHFGVAFGLLLTVFGVLSVASGPVYGYIRDNVQSYELAIALTAGLNGGGALLYAVLAYRTCCRKHVYKKDVKESVDTSESN